MSAAVQRIVIVGRDAALWLTAVLLQRALGATGITVVVVELPSRLAPGAVYATLPPIEALHNRLGIDETSLLRLTGGSFSLGWNVVPLAPSKPYFLAHGSYGTPINGFLFFPHWVKAVQLGLDVAFEDFSPTAMAARQGRVLLPDAETERFGSTNYGYHLPALQYAALLKSTACSAGIENRQTLSLEIEREGDMISAVRVDGGDRIAGDLFIDASGGERLLAGAQPGRNFEQWDVVADRRLVARGPRFSSLPVYSELRLVDDGYATLHAAQAGTEIRFGYRSDLLPDDRALAAAATAAGIALGEARFETIDAGADGQPWTGNCIAIGAAACRIEPLFDLELHIVQLGLVHLLSMVPSTSAFAIERDEYNRILGSSLARLRDLPAVFFALAKAGSPFWSAGRSIEPTASVAHRIATFAARGEVPPLENESFPLDFWQALLIGQGLSPNSWSPLVDRVPLDQLSEEFRGMLSFIKRKVLEQQTHDEYLAGLGGSVAA